ncbi:VCBS repeat-containing protein [Ideonella sp. DXS29W]|uniref:VCBS repeat-containing protein n=1 Tax=Ideonella lacteola TaxID=2984193 RepID=A0ABU9BIE9_9BURK
MHISVRWAATALLASASMVAQAQYRAEFLEDSKAWGSVVADFNNDGHDDIFVCGHHSEDRVWYWTSTGYKPSEQILEWVDRHDCDAADVDHNGRLDLYCAVGAEKGTGDGPKELWLQGEDGIFTLAQNHGAEDPYGRGRLPIFMDFNHDGFADIYLANLSTTRDDGQANINHMFINQGDGHFVEKPTLATGDRGAQCVAKGDINRDGWDDLVVCHEKVQGHVYVNNQEGDFEEVLPPALRGEWTFAKLRDMNGDGRDDLLLIRDKTVFEIWFNTGRAPYFEKLSFTDKLPGIGTSFTVGEFTGDSRPDVYVTLKDASCDTTLVDKAPDVIYKSKPRGIGWQRSVLTQQNYAGCGHLADTVDGTKVLLENGQIDDRGPNYVLSFR